MQSYCFHLHFLATLLKIIVFSFSVSNLLEDSVTARKALETHFSLLTSTLAITITEGVSSIDVTAASATNYTTSNSSAMQACYLGAKICLQLCQHMGDKLKDVLWNEAAQTSSQCCSSSDTCQTENSKIVQNLHSILQSLLDIISNKVRVSIVMVTLCRWKNKAKQKTCTCTCILFEPGPITFCVHIHLSVKQTRWTSNGHVLESWNKYFSGHLHFHINLPWWAVF